MPILSSSLTWCDCERAMQSESKILATGASSVDLDVSAIALSNRTRQSEISVVISFYGDYCDFGGICLASLARQDFRDFEIVFIQDGPTMFQSTLQSDLLRSGLNFIYLINDLNLGAMRSRIKASRAALGKYIAFLDHDDTYSDEFLSKMHQAAITSGADVVECTIQNVDQSGDSAVFRRFGCGDRRFGEDVLVQYLRGFSHNNIWNKLILKNLFAVAEGELSRDLPGEKLNFFDDLLLTILIYKNSKSYAAVCSTHYNYIQRQGSSVNPGELRKIMLVVQEISLVANYVCKKLYKDHYPQDLYAFNKREILWGCDHMLSRLRAYKPRNFAEHVAKWRCIFASIILRYRLAMLPWVAFQFGI